MYKLLLSAAVAASAPASSAVPTTFGTLPAAARRDAQCLTLALLATSVEKDQTKQQAVIAEAWYFMGRLDTEAPGVDLKPALNGAFDAMKGNAETKEIGSTCDAQFEKRGADFRNLGSGE